jgi:phosphate acetyltransferase
MKDFNELTNRAWSSRKTIIFPESSDPRILLAAEQLDRNKLANVVLPGDPAAIQQSAKDIGCDIGGAQLLDLSARAGPLAQTLYELRQHKGLTLEQARQQITDPLIFANVMVKVGEVDGCVAGARYPTGEVVRTALQIVGQHPDYASVSSFFIMLFDKPFHAFPGTMLFADCALAIDPDAEQLADIAVATADTARNMLGIEPRVAMLSFSTQGSAKHAQVDKVVEATRIAKQLRPDCDIFGDVQLDAAIVPEILAQKAPHFASGKRTNVLIFPGLEAGNIGYKLVERFARAEAIGPILQGLNKPANDLSRGCSADDVYKVAVVTAIQAAGCA